MIQEGDLTARAGADRFLDRDLLVTRDPGRSGMGRGVALAAPFADTADTADTADATRYGGEGAVPEGYTARVLVPWGTPILGDYPAFAPGTPPLVPDGNSAADQAQQMGMGHDGVQFLPLGRGPHENDRGLLVLNNAGACESHLHTATADVPAPEQYTADMVRKSQNAHGVAIVEVARDAHGEWDVVRGPFNRRITAATPMIMSGPATGHHLVRTSVDPEGRTPLGTLNDGAHGFTPWGTYLTCEGNFNGHFRLDEGDYDAAQRALHTRYGIGGDHFHWTAHDARFVVNPDEPNEPNRFGWVVEIDPFDASSTPVKRTALGRINHGGAIVRMAQDGRIVIHMFDDDPHGYGYKFVSTDDAWSLRVRDRSPLDDGTLYVARLDGDGSGMWLPLVQGYGPLIADNGFADQGDVLVKTRLAADALGATPIDRPEDSCGERNSGLLYVRSTNDTMKRFLTRVIGGARAGVAMTPDQRTLFTNIRHRGGGGGRTWPGDDEKRAHLSATVVITKDDGGTVCE